MAVAEGRGLFDGETMRGLLLTAYGFSLPGDKGATVALACFIIAIVVALGAAVSLGSVCDGPGSSVQRVRRPVRSYRSRVTG